MKKILILILNKTLTWYFVMNVMIILFADKLTPIYLLFSFFITSIIFCTAALIKISEKKMMQINLSVMDEQRLKRIEEKLGLKKFID